MNVKSKKPLLRIAVQKNGRLREASESLLRQCGLDFASSRDALLIPCKNFPAEILLVRDDDVPQLVSSGVCQLGVVGFNVFAENGEMVDLKCDISRKLGFAECRLAIASPRESKFDGLKSLEGKRIATTYPRLLRKFLDNHRINSQVICVSGSVEVTPMLEIADAICDLVATGTTLRSHGLEERATVLESEGILLRSVAIDDAEVASLIDRFLLRIDGVQAARQSKYIMLNTHRKNLESIVKLIPGMERPTVVPLEGHPDMIALHAVARENIFWETIESLKKSGATSILVVPIEKIIE